MRELVPGSGGSCVKGPNGEWQRIEGSSGPGAASGSFSTFAFFALLLALLPAFVGATLAKDAGVPSAAGFAIGLVGSWIGVIALYLFGQSRTSVGATVGTDVVPDRGPGEGPAVEAKRAGHEAESSEAGSSEAGSSEAAERLRTLKDLRDQGLITQEEYETRRAAAISTL